MNQVIDNFKDNECEFLSNFYPCNITYKDRNFICSEGAFQSEKCAIEYYKYEFINLKGYEAKSLGKKVQLITDWDENKLSIMEDVLRCKFDQNEILKNKLISTFNKKLVEGNTWGDTFWGICRGRGQNNLGKLLMKLRAEYLESKFNDGLDFQNVAIIGGRDFNDFGILEYCVSTVMELVNAPIRIVSGGAKGVDTLGESYADNYGVPKLIFPALWEDLDAIPCKIRYRQDGKAYNALAGFNRNVDIIKSSNLVIAFWDGESRGTKDSIVKALDSNKDVVCFDYNGNLISEEYGGLLFE